MSVTPIYRLLQPKDVPTFKAMCFELYAEDVGDRSMTEAKLDKTVRELQAHPDKGSLMVFEVAGEVVGYSIIIQFWSNEFGGNLTTIDELYVKPEWRGQGLGSGFVAFLEQTQAHSIGLQLEVSPQNVKGQKLYERLGFECQKNTTMVKLITS